MSKRIRDQEPRDPRQAGGGSSGGSVFPPSLIRYLTLAGVAVVIFMNFQIWKATDSYKQQFGQLNARMDALGSKVDSVASRAAQPPRQGPDPNKVYPIRTQGSPAEGPENAPVTIAEFSDFQ